MKLKDYLTEAKSKSVWAKKFEGPQKVFRAPKWDVECGKCGKKFKKKITLAENPHVECPECGANNFFRGVKYR